MRVELSFLPDPPSAVTRLAEVLGTSWPALEKASAAAIEKKDELASALREFILPNTSVIVFGSLARREWTSGSDLDWTLLLDGPADPQHHDSARKIRGRLEEMGVIEPGATGAFGGLTNSHDLIHRIGGLDDSNVNLTQRNLLLLESAPLGEDAAYDRVVRNVLRRYVEEDLGSSIDSPFRVPRFLLNDIARYWRTLAVDFAQKRRDRAGEKWAIRVAKLRMSRKLIYAAGLLTCYSCRTQLRATAEEPQQLAILRVVRHLQDLVRKTPLDIVASAVLDYQNVIAPAGRSLFDAYDGFLAILDEPEARERLKRLPPVEADTDPVYRSVRDLSDRFQEALTEIFFDCEDVPFPGLTKKYGVF